MERNSTVAFATTPGTRLIALFVALAACSSPVQSRTQTVPVRQAAPASTLDPQVQQIAREELAQALATWKPQAAVIVVLDPSTGHVLAAEGDEQGRNAPDLASRKAYVTGSTLKTFTIAAALDAHTLDPTARVDCAKRKIGAGELFDGKAWGNLSVTEVLVTSSNVGTSRIYDSVGLERFLGTLRTLHFGEAPGKIPEVKDGTGMEAVMLAIGESATATPLQVAASYGAIWNDGQYLRPTFVVAAHEPERVLTPETAQTLSTMLEAAVHGDLATGTLARVDGLRVAGKTGTANLDAEGTRYASFVGTVLDRTPRRVILVGLEGPKEGGSGPSAAAPIFARVAQRLMAQTQ